MSRPKRIVYPCLPHWPQRCTCTAFIPRDCGIDLDPEIPAPNPKRPVQNRPAPTAGAVSETRSD